MQRQHPAPGANGPSGHTAATLAVVTALVMNTWP
jgi:hypothetical protein